MASARYLHAYLHQAIEICQRILKINRQGTKPQVKIGRAYYLKGEWNRAVEHSQAALAIDPQDTGARECLDKLAAGTPQTGP